MGTVGCLVEADPILIATHSRMSLYKYETEMLSLVLDTADLDTTPRRSFETLSFERSFYVIPETNLQKRFFFYSTDMETNI